MAELHNLNKKWFLGAYKPDAKIMSQRVAQTKQMLLIVKNE